MKKLAVGDMAPDFYIPVEEGVNIKLSDLKGNYVVLYFYPKDDTPGCTIEAQEFNKLNPEFEKLGAIIIGVSKDSLKSHNNFKEKYCLNFKLASDVESDTCEQYGVWVEKTIFLKKYMGINRATFLIDPKGQIAYIWPKVSALGHAKKVLEVLTQLQNNK